MLPTTGLAFCINNVHVHAKQQQNWYMYTTYTCVAYHNESTKLKDLRELSTHHVFQVFSLHLCHLSATEIKHFLTTGRGQREWTEEDKGYYKT